MLNLRVADDQAYPCPLLGTGGGVSIGEAHSLQSTGNNSNTVSLITNFAFLTYLVPSVYVTSFALKVVTRSHLIQCISFGYAGA